MDGGSTPLRKKNQLLDTRQIFDSLVEVGTLEALVSQNRPRSAPQRPILGTHIYSSFGSVLDTSDIAGHMLGLKGALRAIIWLFKSDQSAAGYLLPSWSLIEEWAIHQVLLLLKLLLIKVDT